MTNVAKNDWPAQARPPADDSLTLRHGRSR
jgi:hypothetical protein